MADPSEILDLIPSRETSPTLLQRRKKSAKACLSLDMSTIHATGDLTPNRADPEDVKWLQEYEVMEVLGQGTMGVVRRAWRRCGGQEVALKIVRTTDPELSMTTCDEIALLQTLQHPHIIQGYSCIVLMSRIILVLEYFPGSNLQDTVRRVPGRHLAEDKARDLFSALISAIAYLHEREIVHRDVKAQNVLINCDLSDLRLIDFNTAQRVAAGGSLSMTGTREWSAPEVLRGESPGYPQDVWGSGLCLFVLLCGRMPRVTRRCHSAEEYAEAITEGISLALRGDRLELLTEPCRETLRTCLEESRADRPEAQVIAHTSRWLKGASVWPIGCDVDEHWQVPMAVIGG